MVAAADSASTVRKKYSVFIYSEAEAHAMYAIYKRENCVFYSRQCQTFLFFDVFRCIVWSLCRTLVRQSEIMHYCVAVP